MGENTQEPTILEFTVPEGGIDRLDTWLAGCAEGFSRSRVQGLIKVAPLRNTAADNGIVEITQRANALLLFVNAIDKKVLAKLAVLRGRVMASASQKPYFSVRLKNGQDSIACLEEITDALSAPDEA